MISDRREPLGLVAGHLYADEARIPESQRIVTTWQLDEGEFPRGHALENIASRVAASRGGELTIEARPGGKGTVARLVFPSRSNEAGPSERGS